MQKVAALMTENLQTASSQDNVFQIAEKMSSYDVGAIPICEQNQLIGIVTDRDIAIRLVAQKLPPSTPVREIMTSEVITIQPEQSIEEASKLMAKYQIRRLPVTKDGMLIGMIAIGDLATHQLHDEKAKQALEKISVPTH